MERHWEEIRDEALRAAVERGIPALRDLSPDHGRIAADRRWKSFFLQGYGYKRVENRAAAPVTARWLDTVPGLVTAVFSVLEAGCHIPRHRGVTKAMLTYHLPLSVPAARERCRMAVDGAGALVWQDGRSFIFDDTFHHEVWNDTDQDRYILLLQVRRPCRGAARVFGDVFLWGVGRSRFVQDIVRRLDGMQHQPAPH